MSDLYRASIRRLRAGIVPNWELERLSVGYADAKRRVNTALIGLRSAEHVNPLFVSGEWGSGKSHFLTFARAAAVARGIPTTGVALNARSMALNHPQRLYSPVVEGIRLDPYDVGLRNVLRGLLMDEEKRFDLLRCARRGLRGHLAPAILTLCAECANGDRFQLDDHPAWTTVLGGDLGWADYPYKRDAAIERLGGVAQLFRALGFGGLTIAFDEAETIDQLWNIRSRVSAYGVLGRLSDLDSVWCIVGITGRFEKTIDADLARGIVTEPRLPEGAKRFLDSWQRRAFEICSAPGIDLSGARSLAATVTRTYEHAFGVHVERKVAAECVEEWARNPSRNPRRLIRLLIHRLDSRRSL